MRPPDVDLDFEKRSIESGRPTTIKTDEIRSIGGQVIVFYDDGVQVGGWIVVIYDV